jgi:hypothetical protein
MKLTFHVSSATKFGVFLSLTHLLAFCLAWPVIQMFGQERAEGVADLFMIIDLPFTFIDLPLQIKLGVLGSIWWFYLPHLFLSKRVDGRNG